MREHLTDVPADMKAKLEETLNGSIEAELTDDQLVELAEGSSSWGAHCNSNSGCD